jgi:hypothetical protein
MDRLRERLDTEWDRDLKTGPTRFETKENTRPMHCAACGELYYLDEATFLKATAAVEGDISETRFYCSDCQEEYWEEER